MTPEVQARLRALENQAGQLNPHDVVADAKDEASPLHSYFDWNDATAAASHRLDQARDLIRSVRVVVTTTELPPRRVAYVRDPGKESSEPGYISTHRLAEEPEQARKALMSELSRADNALARAYDVAFSLGLEGQVENVRAMLSEIREAA